MDKVQVPDVATMDETQAAEYYEEIEIISKNIYPELFIKAREQLRGKYILGSLTRGFQNAEDEAAVRKANALQLDKAREMKKNGEEVQIITLIMQICSLSLPLTQATEWKFLPISKAKVDEPIAIFDIVNTDAPLEELILVVATGTGSIGLVLGKSVLVT